MRRAVASTPLVYEEGVDPRNHRYMWIRAGQDHPCLGAFLRDRTDGIGDQQWHTLFEQERIWVNHVPAGATDSIKKGDRIDIRRIEMQFIQAEDHALGICYRDEHILAIHKPPGMPVHPGLGCHSGTVLNFLRYLLPHTLYMDADLRRMPVHRLDRATSGLLLLGLHQKAQAGLRTQFAQGLVEKTYDAWVWGKPGTAEGVIDIPIGRRPEEPHRITTDPDATFGKSAITRFLSTDHRTGLTRMRLMPQTGRTHQLRIHMAWLGHPIVGDVRYGSVSTGVYMAPHRPGDRLFLHASSLKLRHPVSGQKIELNCDPSDSFERCGG